MRAIRFILATGATLTILAALACGGTSATSSSSGIASTAPTAVFSYVSSAKGYYDSLYSGHAITFTDNSSGTPMSWAWDFGDGATSTEQNPVHIFTVAAINAPDSTNTFTVKLRVSNSSGSTTTSQNLIVHQPLYNIYQDISNQAQSTTVSFSAFAMMTGDPSDAGTICAQTFFPPGKVSDYTGFQYLRDNDPSNMGHNTDFTTDTSYQVLSILTEAQFAQLLALADKQQDAVNQYGYQRYTLIKAFRLLLNQDLPSGSSGLSLSAIKAYSNALYQIDGQIAYDRAKLYANIINQMKTTANPNSSSQTQIAYLDSLRGFGAASWPTVSSATIQDRMQGLSPAEGVLVMTYAGDILSWYNGSVNADVYFCPERHGTYYGGFYLKDAPGMGQPGYSISETLTATAGGVLLGIGSDGQTSAIGQAPYNITQAQADAMAALWGTTEQGNLASIVSTRTQIATLLRTLMGTPDTDGSVLAQVLTLSGAYGEYDGENNYYLATGFANIYNTMLSASQKTALQALRTSILTGAYSNGTPFDFTNCTTYYLYSSPVDESLIDGYITSAATNPLFH
jgi:PKD repeat protein